MPHPLDKFVLHTRCVDSNTHEHVENLNAMTERGRQVSAKTFFRHVDLETISRQLGYAYGRAEQGVRLARDYHVRFFRSRWRGRACYYLVWSAIEHVFLAPDDHKNLTC